MTTSILLPLGEALPMPNIFEATLALAQPLQAHVTAVYVRADPDVAANAIPEIIMTGEATRDVIARDIARTAAAPDLLARAPVPLLMSH